MIRFQIFVKLKIVDDRRLSAIFSTKLFGFVESNNFRYSNVTSSLKLFHELSRDFRQRTETRRTFCARKSNLIFVFFFLWSNCWANLFLFDNRLSNNILCKWATNSDDEKRVEIGIRRDKTKENEKICFYESKKFFVRWTSRCVSIVSRLCSCCSEIKVFFLRNSFELRRSEIRDEKFDVDSLKICSLKTIKIIWLTMTIRQNNIFLREKVNVNCSTVDRRSFICLLNVNHPGISWDFLLSVFFVRQNDIQMFLLGNQPLYFSSEYFILSSFLHPTETRSIVIFLIKPISCIFCDDIFEQEKKQK